MTDKGASGFGEWQVGEWHGCIPRRTVRLCASDGFSAEYGLEIGLGLDDGRGGFEDGFDFADDGATGWVRVGMQRGEAKGKKDRRRVEGVLDLNGFTNRVRDEEGGVSEDLRDKDKRKERRLDGFGGAEIGVGKETRRGGRGIGS